MADTVTVYDVPDLKNKVRQSDGEGQTIYDRVDDIKRHHIIPGPQQNTAGRQTQGQQTIGRRLKDAALWILCVILLAVIAGLAVHYNSAIKQLQIRHDKLGLEKKLLEKRHNNQTVELQHEVNQLREAAVKLCPCGWQKFGFSCYYRSTEETHWEESRENCLQKGADLVIINSKEEQDFIRGLTCGKGASWIGLNKTEIEGKWTWLDGTTLTTGYWASGRPYNNTNHNCVKYNHKQGNWIDEKCEEEITSHSICEK